MIRATCRALAALAAPALLGAVLLGAAAFAAGCDGNLSRSDVELATRAAGWIADELSQAESESDTGDQTEPAAGQGNSLVPRVERATVVRVVDGDTARFLLPDGTEEPVRFIGIDTPESTRQKEPWGAEAAEFTRTLLPRGAVVYLEYDVELRDRYDRLLAYVWLERPESAHSGEVRFKMANAQIVLAGCATPLTIQPNSRYADLFSRFTEEARADEVGMWNPDALSVFEQVQ